MTPHTERVPSKLLLGGTDLLMGLALVLALAVSAAPAKAAGTDDGRLAAGSSPLSRAGDDRAARGPIPDSVAAPISRAENALGRATANLRTHHPRLAITALMTVKHQLGIAHRAGMAQIGKPPTNPESDDPPGPPSVTAVLKLEHVVGNGLVGLFDGRRAPAVVHTLRLALIATHHHRDAMLDKVIALPPEGDGADYTDDMADSLGRYAQEVKFVSAALAKYQLTAAGRVGLDHALDRVTATKAKMERAYGGGERLAT